MVNAEQILEMICAIIKKGREWDGDFWVFSDSFETLDEIDDLLGEFGYDRFPNKERP